MANVLPGGAEGAFLIAGIRTVTHKHLFLGSRTGDSVPVKSEGANSMNVPLAKQTEKYQEQLIPARRDHWPEIIVSFGKYDNQVDEIRYFPVQQVVINSHVTAAIPFNGSL
jgi:hypothetical protein